MKKGFNPAELRGPAGKWVAQAVSALFRRKTPVSRFFQGSKVQGTVYHGTARNIRTFSSKIPSMTRHPTAAWGHFFSSDPEIAASFAGAASRWRNAGDNIIPVRLNIQTPYTMSPGEARRRINAASALGVAWQKKWVADLQAKGYDGIHILPDKEDPELAGHTWVAFFPNQIKSIFNNAPTSGADMTKGLKPETIAYLKGAGLAARRGSRTTLRGSRQRQPYMGRARLYANRRVVKD